MWWLVAPVGMPDEDATWFLRSRGLVVQITSLILGAVAIALLAGSPAQAQRRTMFVTVEELKSDCADKQQICVGFITGVADALEATAWPAKRSCRGNDVSLGEVLERAIKLLKGAPLTKVDSPAFDYLADEFVSRWPC